MRTEALSYWQTTVSNIPLSSELPSTADIVIIGGGIIGVSICYWLAREGMKVTLLERNMLAYGATGRNGGFIVDGPAEPYQKVIANLGHKTAYAILQLTRENRILLHQVLEEEEIQCNYQDSGNLRIAVTEQKLKDYKEEVEALHIDNFPIDLIDHDQVQSLIKTPISTEIIGGQFLHGQATVHSAKLVAGLAQAALKRGANFYHAEAIKIASQGSHAIVYTTTQEIQCKRVIVATNAWISKLIPELKNIIIPIHEQMLSYAPTESIFTTGVTTEIANCEYWQQVSDGTILIGGCGVIEKDQRIGKWDLTPTVKTQEAIEQILPRLFPQLKQLYPTQRWAGLLDYTKDAFPIVDRVPNIPEAFFAAGFSGHGMPFGLRIGQLLATTIQTNNIPDELQPYRIDRPTLEK